MPPVETVRLAAKALPAPPPLSAPLSTAGTGPNTELRRTMAPAGETWWTEQGSAPPHPYAPSPQYSSPGGGYGSAPPGGYSQAPSSQAPGQPPPGQAQYGQPPPGQPPRTPAQQASHPPAPNSLLQNPYLGGIVLGVGIVFLIAGAAGHAEILVIIGLVAGAWGIWQLVSQIGNNTKPPGRP